MVQIATNQHQHGEADPASASSDEEEEPDDSDEEEIDGTDTEELSFPHRALRNLLANHSRGNRTENTSSVEDEESGGSFDSSDYCDFVEALCV